MRFTTLKMPSFRELEQKWWPKVGALLELQWRMEEKEKQRKGEGEKRAFWKFGAEWGERELLFGFKKKLFPLFFLFYLSYATCLHLSGAKRAHFLFWLWPIHSHRKWEKNLTFETLKSYLGLRVISLIPVPRVSLRPSGPVFESSQYIYIKTLRIKPRVWFRGWFC